ncbi:sensor histidine kinase [Aquirhabdus parva]|nr:ATP-binding protein [Aquirhabdus parva]
MAGRLEKTWIRLGIYMTLFVLVTISVFVISVEIREQLQFRDFLAQFPADKRAEVARSVISPDQSSPELCAYLTQFAMDGSDGLSGNSELLPLILGLIISLLAGLGLAFVLTRMFIRPVASIAEAASMIAAGDLTVRAQILTGNNELANMIANFNQMASSIEDLERERKATAAAISHELRTPLTILNGRLHALCDGVIPPSAAEHRKLLEQTQHLVRLVEDVHTLGLDNAEKLTLYCVESDLAELVRDFAPNYADRALESGVTLVVNVQSARVFADRDRINQIISNLVENALRYAKNGKRVELNVYPETDSAIFEVRDHGAGLPQGMSERIFDPFYRLDQSRSRATGGSGLGLAVVRSLVEQHQGVISAYNHPEGGAVFRVILPLFL